MVKRHPLNMTPPGWKGENGCEHDSKIIVSGAEEYNCLACGAQLIIAGRHYEVTYADGIEYIRASCIIQEEARYECLRKKANRWQNHFA